MFEITNRLQYPYASICYIQCDWGDGSVTRASGVVVGLNDVLTALHVVFDTEHGGWATRITIIPAADTQPASKPYGEFSSVGTIDGRAATWDIDGDRLLTQAESAGDLALIGLETAIGNITGWLPVVQMPNDFYGVVAGYPAAATGLMADSVFADASGFSSVYSLDSSLGPGASGGPLLQTIDGVTSVAGVLSGGNASGTASTYAGLFGSGTWDWLQSAMAGNNGLLGGNVPTSVATAGGTLVTGTSAADVLFGSGGRDVFNGHGGNDTLDGLAGLDTAVYAGGRAGYTIIMNEGSITVVDNAGAGDGVDLLSNIERVRFTDLSLAFDVTGSAGQAYRLYQTVLNREPDIAGLGYQMKALDDGLSLVQLANNFIRSPEFQQRFGNLSDADFVTQLYAYALHREPDGGGFLFHTGNLASGAATRAETVMGFSESPEQQAALIGVMQGGMAYTV